MIGLIVVVLVVIVACLVASVNRTLNGGDGDE